MSFYRDSADACLRTAVLAIALVVLPSIAAADTSLVDAVNRNDAVSAARLLTDEGDVNSLNGFGEPLLHVAAFRGSLDLIKLLIDRGAKIDATNSDGQATALHVAAEHGRASVIQLFIDRGAKVDVRNMHNATPLHIAAQNGRDDIAVRLLAKGADVDARNVHQATALHIAAAGGRLDVAEALLAAGADVDAKNLAGARAEDLLDDDSHLRTVFDKARAARGATPQP